MDFIIIINDCQDQNERGRQLTKYSCLFPGVNVNFIGVNSNLNSQSTLEAGGCLIDVLDASGGQSGLVALNSAPRGVKEVEDYNGSPFCYFKYKDTLVTSTVRGYSLSFVKKFGIVDDINVLDEKEVLSFALSHNLLDEDQNNIIANTQFRSLNFQPIVANWLVEGVKLPSTTKSINTVPDLPDAIWYTDSFGNAKTTLTKNDLDDIKIGEAIKTNFGELKYYNRLKDLDTSETALYEGSSGIRNQRFLEIAKQNTTGSVKAALGIKVGDNINIV